MRASMRTGLLLLSWVLAGVLPCVAGETLDEADRAFEAGDHPRALELYDEALAENPAEIQALVRSGMLLSWQREFDEALGRYERCIELEPDNRKALLERAKVMSWDRRYAEATDAFRAFLDVDPDDREARLGLARSLSWSGQQQPAREQYERVLSDHPGDAEALVGTAQTYAWSGDGTQARGWYGRALEQQPGMKDAELGLAYVELWAGDPVRARERADGLAQSFPEDPEVAELQQAIDKALAPWVRGTYDIISDTDGNDLGIFRVEGGFGLADALDLRLGFARWDMSDRLNRSAGANGLYGVLGWRITSRQRIEFRAGVDRLENTAGSTDNQTVGGVSWIYRPEGRWELRASARRDPYLYSTEILDNGILIDALELNGNWRPADRWRIDGALGFWDLSDGNSRVNLLGTGFYSWPLRAVTVEAGYAFQYQNYAQNLNNGYFDPSNFIANLAIGRARGKFGSTRYYWEAEGTVGLQSFELDGIDVNNDTVLGARLLGGFPLGAGMALEVYLNRTDYALQSASGFSSNGAGIRLRWQGGN